MKIRRSTSRRALPLSEEVRLFVENGTKCDEEALITMLEHAIAQDVWVFPRSDLHQWADLLDRFDGLYARIIDEYWSKTTELQEKGFTENDKQLSSSMMKFSRLLLEYCSSRNLYNSYEHLRKYLTSSDLDVLESTLELLLLPARKLESQPSLRNTFERLVGPEELGVLAQINVPPFVEPRKDSVLEAFQPYHTQRMKMSTVPQDQLKYIRMLAMACYLFLMSTSGLELDSSLFAANPTIIGDIARSLTAKPVAPMKRETAVLCVLRASLKIHSKASEIIYALNLSAGHGPVAAILRAVCESLKAKEEPPFHPFFVGAFLDFLAALGMNSMIGDGDIALVNAGVIEDIIKSLGDCSPTQHKILDRLLTIVDVLIHRVTEAMDAFFTTEGLHAVVNQISLLVHLPISETLGFEESSLLNSHLRFIDRLLMSHGGDDRLRNLVEGNLFKSLKLIFEKSSLFPQESFSYSISILSNFVHNEPTSLSFLQEQGVPQAFLHAVTQYPKLPAQSELFLRLPQAFSAICLNSLGVQQFLEMNPMSRLFEPFLDPETYLKCMKSHMTSSEYGRAIDEFMRHQPKFRDDAIKAMIETIKSYPALLQRYQTQVKANGNVGYQLVEIDSDLKEISMIPLSEAIEKMKKPESNPAINMLDNFTMTIEGILQSPAHSKEFIDAGGIDCLLDVYSSPGFGYDFTARQESFSISHIFRLISENDSNGNSNETESLGAASVLLSVWKHVFRCSESIEHSFLARTDFTSIFGQLLKENLDIPTLAQLDSLFQPLCSLLAILGLLGDLYIQHSFTFTRSAGTVIKGLASTPEGGAAIHFLSLLLGSTIWEHHLFDLEIPSSHLKAFSKLHQIISSQYGSNPFKAQVDPNELCPDPDDPRVKNTFACRFLSEKIPSSIMAIFGGLSRMLSGRRSNLDLENSDILKVSSMLANSIANNLEALHVRQPNSMTEWNPISLTFNEAVASIISMANLIFFDETHSRLTVQILPLTSFAEIGGLKDLEISVRLVMHSIRWLSSIEDQFLADKLLYTWRSVIELYLVLLGRVTNAQTYRINTWDDLGSLGFPRGLRQWLALAGKSVKWFWSDMDDKSFSQLSLEHVRLILALTSNLLVDSQNLSTTSSIGPHRSAMKQGELEFYGFLHSMYPWPDPSVLPLDFFGKFPLDKDESYADIFSWLALRPLPEASGPIMAKIFNLTQADAILYDLAVLLLKAIPPIPFIRNDEGHTCWRHFVTEKLIPSCNGKQEILLRLVAILGSSHLKVDIVKAIVSSNILLQLQHWLSSSQDFSLIAPGSLIVFETVSLMTVPGGIPDLPFCKWAFAWTIEKMKIEALPVNAYHGLLLSLLSLSRIENVIRELENVSQFLSLILKSSMSALDSHDLRNKSIFPISTMIIRHFFEQSSSSYLQLMMEMELVSKFRPSSRYLAKEFLLTANQDSFIGRDWKAFEITVKKNFALKDEDEHRLILRTSLPKLDEDSELLATMEEQTRKNELLKGLVDNIDETCPSAQPLIDILLDLFLALPPPKIFLEPTETIAAERNDSFAKDHFMRAFILSILSDLTSTIPACHVALLRSKRSSSFFEYLLDKVVPCGDLFSTTTSTLFVNGPIWVDFLMSSLCVGPLMPGFPISAQKTYDNVKAIIGPLSMVLEHLIEQLKEAENSSLKTPYSRMSKVWCLSMTVYSLLNMKGAASTSPVTNLGSRQVELVQSSIAKAMLEMDLVGKLTTILGSIDSSWPAFPMVSAKLVLALELLAKYRLKLTRPRTSSGFNTRRSRLSSVVGTEDLEGAEDEEGMDLDSMAEVDFDDSHSSGSDDHSSNDVSTSDMDIDIVSGDDDATSSDEAAIEPEEFGYGQESSLSEMSTDDSSDDDDDSDIIDDTDDAMSLGSDSDSEVSDGSSSSYYTEDEMMDDISDDDGIQIIMQPPRIAIDDVPQVFEGEMFEGGDDDGDEMGEDGDDGTERHGHFLEEFDFDHDEDEDDGEDEDEEYLDALNSDYGDDDDAEMDQEGIMNDGDDIGAQLRRGRNIRGPSFNDEYTLMGDNSAASRIFGLHPYSSSMFPMTGSSYARATASSSSITIDQLPIHPLLQRPPGAPVTSSTRQTDLGLVLRPSIQHPGLSVAPHQVVHTHAILPIAEGSVMPPFYGNREAFRNPATISLIKRWTQETKMLFGDCVSEVSQEFVSDILASLKPEMEARKAIIEARRLEDEKRQAEIQKVLDDKREKEKEEVGKERQDKQQESQIETKEVEPQLFVDNGPDIEFLLALPFDMRREVIEQYLQNDRREAVQRTYPDANQAGLVNIEISAAFLSSLPEDLAEEYKQMSAQEDERFKRRIRRIASGPSGAARSSAFGDDFFDFLLGEGNGIRPTETAVLDANNPQAFVERLAQSLRAALSHQHHDRGQSEAGPIRIESGNLSALFRMPQDDVSREVNLLGPSGDGISGNQMVEGKIELLPPQIQQPLIDSLGLSTLLLSYFVPSMTDKKTHLKLFKHLCMSHSRTRTELMNILIMILEQMPSSLEALEQTINGTVALSSPSNTSSASGSPPSVTPKPTPRKRGNQHSSSNYGPDEGHQNSSSNQVVVILQRTLQLLISLVSHDQASLNFFTQSTSAPWTIKRVEKRQEKWKQVGMETTRYPLVLLLACLEKPQFLNVGLLLEFLLNLIATVSAPIPKLKSTDLPQIPSPFLHSLVKSIGSSELTPKAFSHAQTIFQKISKIELVADSLLIELSEACLRIVEVVGKDLQSLAKDSGAIKEFISSKSGAIASVSQTRLLRLLKMLLVVFTPSASSDVPDNVGKFPTVADTVLANLEKDVWKAGLINILPDILDSIGEEADVLHLAIAMLPAIESFFLYFRLATALSSIANKSSAVFDDGLLKFAEKHRKIINTLIRSNPALLTVGSLNELTKHTKVLDFDNKRVYFKTQLGAMKKPQGIPSSIHLNVRRQHIFEDSFTQLIGRTGDELRFAKLNVKFHGEEGIDAGGVTREWYSDLCKKVFNPDNGLFVPSAGDKVAVQPNRMSWVNPDHLQFFNFVGRIIAKAICDSRLLDIYFTRSFYKHLLGIHVDIRDLEAVDPDFYKSLQWILENDITNVVELTFSTDTEEFGVRKVIDLKEGGSEIPVTEANKAEYAKLVTEYRLTTAIQPQIDAVLRGFYAIIPDILIKMFNEKELELLISGLPDIDIDDWRANTEYQNYSVASPQVQWFWRAVRSFDPEERANLVQFVTGTSKVPLEGWAHLQGSSGRQKFTITRDFGSTHRLPSAHTCFNQLDLPAYESYEMLRAALLKAFTEGATGFGFA